MKDKIQVSKVLIQNTDGDFLVLKDRESRHWEPPGGKIEENEDRFEAAKREVLEEVGLEIQGLEELVRIEVEDSECANCWIFHSEKFEGDVDLEQDFSEHRWVSADDFCSMNWKTHAGYDIPVMKRIQEFI